MSLYAISDLHLSLGTEKSMEIFPGWENYIYLLEKNWKATVKKEDTVVVCGDISWAMRIDEAFKDFEFLNSLPGEKILLKGNHDYWWSTNKKIEDFFKKNEFENFKILHNNCIETQGYAICGARGWTTKTKDEHDDKMVNRELIRLDLSLKSCKNNKIPKIVCLHYPPVYFNETTKIIDFLHDNKIKYCYYGHIHSKDSSKYISSQVVRGIKCELVSCDYLRFKPKLVDI